MAAFSESYTDAQLHNSLFVKDGVLWTCAGEFAAFDLALEMVGMWAGKHLAPEICRYATVNAQRAGSSRQTGPAGLVFTSASKRLVAATQIMEDHIENPLSLAKIAKLSGISRRQLERLFGVYVKMTPLSYYTKIRVDHARRLVEGTDMPLIDIAMACGFQSASNFSKVYRAFHGLLPSSCRPTVKPVNAVQSRAGSASDFALF